MFVTTVEKTTELVNKEAMQIAVQFSIPYVERKKRTIKQLQAERKCDCLVIGKEVPKLYSYEKKEQLFFHLNMASIRIKRLQQKSSDAFISVAKLERGSTILDCTLGMASDSIVASYVVGATGKVVGLEKNPFVHYIMSEGLQHYQSTSIELNDAMRRIVTYNKDYSVFLSESNTNQYDVVYFDPMFGQTIEESKAIQALASFAELENLVEKALEDSLRVARKRVILKGHFKSKRFSQLGFEVHSRKSAQFHYGVIEVN